MPVEFETPWCNEEGRNKKYKKMIGPVARIYTQSGRNVMKNFVRNGSQGGIPGENMPFNIHNRKRLTFNLFWYALTGIGSPFLILQWQLMKKST